MQMKAQCVGNICTTTYVEPIDPDKRTLDHEKQTYIYSVFDKVVKTSFRMYLVTQCAGDNTCATKFGKDYYIMLMNQLMLLILLRNF